MWVASDPNATWEFLGLISSCWDQYIMMPPLPVNSLQLIGRSSSRKFPPSLLHKLFYLIDFTDVDWPYQQWDFDADIRIHDVITYPCRSCSGDLAELEFSAWMSNSSPQNSTVSSLCNYLSVLESQIKCIDGRDPSRLKTWKLSRYLVNNLSPNL